MRKCRPVVSEQFKTRLKKKGKNVTFTWLKVRPANSLVSTRLHEEMTQVLKES